MAMVPTKGNLIIAKNTLALSKTGYGLLDKKRNILIREMMNLIDAAKTLQSKIESTFTNAYSALEQANIDIGIETVEKIGYAMAVEDSLEIKFRSVMGVEIPIVMLDEQPIKPDYGMKNTGSALDEAVVSFVKVKYLTRQLAQIENIGLSACRQHQKDPKTRERSEKYYDSEIQRKKQRIFRTHLTKKNVKNFRGLK